MGPPGGGRNDITGRFTRHLQVVSIDEFDDITMSRIFTAIADWHFSKGFDTQFLRFGKVETIHIMTYDFFRFLMLVHSSDSVASTVWLRLWGVKPSACPNLIIKLS